MRLKSIFVFLLFISTSLSGFAKCNFSVKLASGDTLPTIAYLTSGESLHLVIHYDNEFDCDIIVDDFSIYKDNVLYEEFPLPYGNSGSLDAFLTEEGVYTGYLHYPSGNMTQLWFTLEIIFNSQTGIESLPDSKNPFHFFSENGSMILDFSSNASCISKLNLYNKIGQLIWTVEPERTTHYLVNISNIIPSTDIYLIDALVDEKNYSLKVFANK